MFSASFPRWRQVAGRALDLLLPPLCLACDAPVTADRTLCPDCWKQVHFIAPPFCAGCGMPFDIPVDEGNLCGGCIANPPDYTKARAAMLYDDASKGLVLAFKHADRIHPAPALASWMLRAGQELLVEADLIVPVPLHRWRLFTRRYNQAALLAQNLGLLTQKPVLVDALYRLRPTPIQGHLNRKERQANVKGAFGLNERYRRAIEDKTILLVDDVLTTGATVNECSRVLLKAGARAVNVLVLARVRSLL